MSAQALAETPQQQPRGGGATRARAIRNLEIVDAMVRDELEE